MIPTRDKGSIENLRPESQRVTRLAVVQNCGNEEQGTLIKVDRR